MIFLLLLAACAPPPPTSYLAWQVTGAGYDLAPRPVGAVQDMATLEGPWIQGHAGGEVVYLDDGDCAHEGGRPLHVQYDVQDNVAVPFDQQGLILWSLNGHLEDFSLDLVEAGLDDAGLLPVTLATTPVLPDLLLEMMPYENAAYATGCNVFIVLEDMINKDIPLAANAGVIRHEMGHGVFHVLTAGGVDAPGPFEAGDLSAGALYYASLSEGVADMTASLTLDDPDFIEVSLAMPERDVSGDWRASLVTLPEEFLEEEGDSVLPLYDPYPLGTVFAATAWDLRVATDDPQGTWLLALAAVELWMEGGDPGQVMGFLDALVALAPEPQVVCDSVATRFAGVYEVAACGD